MAKMGKFDTKELKDFQEKLEKIDRSQVDAFLESCAKELAARLLAMVIKRTPIGDYPEDSGKKGGTLRRGWTGGKRSSAKEYANSLTVKHEGNNYIIEIVNPVSYASYVEYGHRQEPGRFVPALGKKLKKGWVEGKYMMTISENELRDIAPKVLKNKLKKFLGEAFS